MENRDHMTSWLDHLFLLMPPRDIVMVGAGNGNSPWVQWMVRTEVPSATLVEADEGQIALLQRNTELLPAWRVRKLVVAAATAPVTFHVASVTSESGLLDPEMLRGQWPNIKTRETQTRHGVALAELLQDDHAVTNWLVVDCLPTLPILNGAGDQLANIDVLVVRVLFDSAAPSILGVAHQQDDLLAWLAERGLRHMANETGRHPALGHALFVRDIADRLGRAHAKHLADLLSRHTKELQTLHADDRAEHNRLREALSACQQQLQDTGNRLAQAEQNQRNLQQANHQLNEEHATALQRLKNESQVELDRLSATLNEQTRKLQDAEAQHVKTVQAIQQELGEVHATALRQLHQTDLMERTRELQELKLRFELVTASHQEHHQMNKQLAGKMARLLAQVALIDEQGAVDAYFIWPVFAAHHSAIQSIHGVCPCQRFDPRASVVGQPSGLFTKGDQDALVYLMETDPLFAAPFCSILDHQHFNFRDFEYESRLEKHFLLHFTGKKKAQDNLRFCERMGVNEYICPPDLIHTLAPR